MKFSIGDTVMVLDSQYNWLIGQIGKVVGIHPSHKEVYRIHFDDQETTKKLIDDGSHIDGCCGEHYMRADLLKFIQTDYHIDIEGLI